MKTYHGLSAYHVVRAFGAALTMAAVMGIGATACVSETDEDNNGVDPEDGEPLGEAKGPISYNNHDYLLFMTPRDWTTARQTCQYAGYYLVTINDANEESFLHSQEIVHNGNFWWIGYNDQVTEGSWSWANGTSTYTNWMAGEPNSAGDEDCALDNWSEGKWNDSNCSNTANFVCERDSIPLLPSGTFTYAASNTNSATQNVYDFPVSLMAGQTITFGTCGLPAALNGCSSSSSTLRDTYLRLNDPSGAPIVANDDSCGGLGSNASAIAPTTGTYIIRAGCWSSSMCTGTVAYTIQ